MDDDWQPVGQSATPAPLSDDWQPVKMPTPSAGDSAGQPAPQPQQQQTNAWKEPVKQVDFSPSNIGNAAVGALKDTAMMIPNTLSDIGRMVYGSDDKGALIGPRKPIITPDLKETAGNIANLALPFMAVPAEANITRPMTTEEAAAVPNIQQSVANFRNDVAASKAPYDPMTTMKAISNSFNDAIDKANTFYGFPQQLAEGRSVSAPQVANHLDSVIQDVNDSPWHEAKSQVGTLQRIRDSLPDDGTVPVNDLLDLRKFTNKFFNPARMTDKGATYGQLNSAVDSGLNAAKQTIPNFEDALDIADNYWRNNVTSPFLKNKVLQKAWSPEDAHNLRMVDDGYLDEPGDLTQQRAQNLVQTVKDVPSYNAIRRTLPDDVGQSFDAAVLQNMPTGRAQAAGKAVANTLTGHWPTALRNVADVINPDLSDAEKATIQAVKKQNTYTPLSTKNDVAQAAYENLMQANMRGEGHPLGLPEPPMYGAAPQAQTPSPQLALPKPGYNPFSPENIGKLPSPSSVSGPRMNEPVTRDYTPTSHEMRTEKESLSPKQLPAPSSIQVPSGGFRRTYSPNDLNAGDEGQALSTLEGIADGKKSGGRISRASGGRINHNPSEAQKNSGNYKKGHMRCHGLAITIENYKGSIRRGKDKDGKEWRSELPARYGYIRGTVGADNDHVDCYIGDDPYSEKVYVVDQVNHENKRFDEHKCLINFGSLDSAIRTYKKAFSDNKGHERIGKVTEMNIEQFKDWLKRGDTTKPMKVAA